MADMLDFMSSMFDQDTMSETYEEIDQKLQEQKDEKHSRNLSSLSPGNPYAIFLRNAHKAGDGTDYKRLLTEAIQWEANLAQNDVNRKNALDASLIDVVSKRKAGINPDISGASGSGGGTSLPAMADTDLATLKTPIEQQQADTARMQAIASTISAVGSGFSALTSGISTITDTIQSVRNFDNVLSLSDAQARMVQAGAGVAESQALDQQIMSRISTGLNLAKLFPIQRGADGSASIPELQEVSSFLNQFGIEGADGVAPFVHSIMSNPELESKYNDALHAAGKSRAEAITRGFDFYQSFNELSKKLELTATQSNFYSAQFSENFNKLLSESNIAELTIDNQELEQDVLSTDLQNRRQDASLYARQIKRDISAFDASLRELVVQRKSLEDTLTKYTSDVMFASSPEGQREISRIRLAISEIDTLGSSQLQTIFDTMLGVEQRMYVIESTGLLNKPFMPGDIGNSILPSDFTQDKRNQLNWWNLSWHDYYNDPDRWGQALNSGIDAVLNTLGDLVSSKYGKKSISTGAPRAPRSNYTRRIRLGQIPYGD